MWGLYVWPLYVWPLYVNTLCVTTLWEHSMCDHSMCDHSMWALFVWALYVWPLYVWPLYVWPLYVWPFYVSTLCVTNLCEHSMCDHSMWAPWVWPIYVSTLCVTTLCVTALCVTTLYVSTLCVTTLCEHSMCDHSMWTLHVWPLHVSTLCVTTLWEQSMCDHSMWALYVWPPYVSTLCVCDHSMWALYVWPLFESSLCVTTLCEHSMCDHPMWALYVWPLYVSTLCVTTLCVTTLCEHSMCDHSMWALYVWPLYVSTLCVTTLWEHSLCDHPMWPLYVNTEKYENYYEKWTSVLGPDVADHRKVRKLPRKMNISSWAGCCRTPKSTKITRKHRLQFLSRMLQRQKHQKSPGFIVKTPVKSIAEHRKVRELPRKMNIEEVEAPKKYENSQTKPVLDPFKSTAGTRKVRELPRKMNIEEVEEPETMKIYRQNPFTPAAATRKLRKFTDETNMQARNHENSDEFCTEPRPPPRSSHPGFYYYRKNPKCYHTVWGKSPHPRNLKHFPLMMGVMINFFQSGFVNIWKLRSYTEMFDGSRIPKIFELMAMMLFEDNGELERLPTGVLELLKIYPEKNPASDSRRVDLAFHSPFLCKWAMRTMFEATCMQDTPDRSRLEDTARVLFFSDLCLLCQRQTSAVVLQRRADTWSLGWEFAGAVTGVVSPVCDEHEFSFSFWNTNYKNPTNTSIMSWTAQKVSEFLLGICGIGLLLKGPIWGTVQISVASILDPAQKSTGAGHRIEGRLATFGWGDLNPWSSFKVGFWWW